MPKVLCTFGVVLVCLHTFVVVRTIPTGRQTPDSLQPRLKLRNITERSKAFNLTQSRVLVNSDDKYTTKGYRDRTALSSMARMDTSLIHAPSTNVRQGKLYSKYGFFVQMLKDGSVDGTMNYTSPTVLFEFQSVQVGVLRIKNVSSRRYLGMDKNGNLRGRIRRTLETLFSETQAENDYHCYTSYKYKTWYLGIRRNGSRKPGRHTGPHQKAIQFLPVYSD